MERSFELAAILRDAALRAAPQDEVGDCFASRTSVFLKTGCDK
jgi:hypothetical protein